MEEVEQQKWSFLKFTYYDMDLNQLLDMPYGQLLQLYSICQRRPLNKDLQWMLRSLFSCLSKAKEVPLMEKPEMVTGSRVDLYNKPLNHFHHLHQLNEAWLDSISAILSSHFIP